VNAEPLLQNLDQLEEAVSRAGLATKPLAPLLDRVRSHIGRYTKLESELAGGVGVDLPLHLLDEEEALEPEEQARHVARRERVRLDLGDGPVGGMRVLLEHEGLKVYLPPFPPETGLLGFFLFDEQAGPVFVADGGLEPDRADLVLAQLYGNFLLDHDPYSIRLVTAAGNGDPAAERARRFATVFLVSPEGLARYLVALGWEPGGALSVSDVRELALFFEMLPARFLERLQDLRFGDLPDPAEVEGGEPAGAPPPGEPVELGPLSERFLRLALEGHARGLLDDASLARHLETDRRGAMRMAARFRADAEATPYLATPEDDG
jgi:hypothetical protein